MNIKLVSSGDTTTGAHNTEGEVEKLFKYVVDYFQKNNPNPTTELEYKNEYELLVATILSARCTDERVNMVTPDLFQKYPTPGDLANAKPEDVYQYISSITFANNKSDYLVGMAKILVKKYDGNVPVDDDKLQRLPGVGRKTAHVIMATLFNKPVIAVDTHVARVSERIGLATGDENPLDIEKQLMLYTPKDVMSKMSHWLILHGRYICTSRSPKCKKCGIKNVCKYFNV